MTTSRNKGAVFIVVIGMPSIQLPDYLVQALDERRGVLTRTQLAANIIATALGLEAPVLRRGRPPKETETRDPTQQAIDYIDRIGRNDDEYRKAWVRRVSAAADALEAMGATMDETTRERLIREQHEAFPDYHPLALPPDESR